MRGCLLLAFCLSLLLTAVTAANAITFANGPTHTLTSRYLSEEVFDGPGPTQTTVNIEAPATIHEDLRAHDNSVTNMNAGVALQEMFFDQTSVMNMR